MTIKKNFIQFKNAANL